MNYRLTIMKWNIALIIKIYKFYFVCKNASSQKRFWKVYFRDQRRLCSRSRFRWYFSGAGFAQPRYRGSEQRPPRSGKGGGSGDSGLGVSSVTGSQWWESYLASLTSSFLKHWDSIIFPRGLLGELVILWSDAWNNAWHAAGFWQVLSLPPFSCPMNEQKPLLETGSMKRKKNIQTWFGWKNFHWH